jgi:DNA-binding CsgD family transcriptional regulator
MSSVLEEMRAVLDGDEELLHYGTKRHSGRYPYGSGEDPYQHGGDFLSRVEELQNRPGGWAETAENVQKEFGMKLEEYRNEKHWANYTRKEQLVQKGLSLREKGMGNSAIARELGLPNESSVRSMLDPKAVSKMQASKKVAEFLKEQVDAKGMLDIGKDSEKFVVVGEGVDKTLGVTRTKLDQAIYALEAEGYVTYPARIEQPTNRGNHTTQLVLCKPGTPYSDVYNYPDKIHTIEDFKSSDGGESFQKKFTYPSSLDSKRLMVRYADDVGTDGFKGIEKDGIIELRRGVKDLSLEGTKYAQVRILVDDTHYLKGMAVYSDDMPPGVDVIFNTNKKSDVPALGPKDNTVLKRIKADPENPFGSLIKDADKGGQYWYDDPKTGEKKLGLINKKADEGDWSEWTDALPSQFLSKQNKELIKRQLNLAANERHEEFERICEINNPTIKKHLLKSFAEDCDGAAVNLKAAALPKQKYHVIIPVNSLKDTEVYAPGYDDGTKLALIRYPHAGIFEIPVLTVNNKNALGKKLLGKDTMDGIGINSKIAEQLSGADFDGDTVMAIPTDYGNIKISRSPYLKELKGFDAKVEYATHVGEDGKRYNDRGDKVPILPKQRVGYEMGVISNLITDMTLAGGASPDEMARAVKHSMVVIDAEKHKLDYKRSEVENNIAALKAKYQITVKEDGELKTGGAATIISRAKSPEKVPKRRGQGIIDKETGELTYLPALPDDLHYVKITKNKKGLNTIKTTDGKTIKYDPDDPEAVEKYKPVRKFNDDGTVSYTNKAGDISYKVETRTQDSTKMAEAKDAYSLVSAARHPAELLYADYANNMKALANTARKEMVTTGNIEYKKSAAETYKAEVDSLLARLNEAEKNSVRERQAVRLATAEIRSKKAADPDMDKGDLRKISQKAMSKARQEAGSVSRRDRNILITDREWEAIQAGAVRETTLRRILNNADIDDLRQRATPRDSKAISTGKAARIKNLSATGNYTIAEIANQVGLSVTTVKKYLKGVD